MGIWPRQPVNLNKKMRFMFFVVLVWLAVLPERTAFSGDCSVCLGRNLSVAFSEHTERLYLKIGDSPKIFFYKPHDPPRIVATGLDRKKRHLVKVFFDDQVVQSWYLDFEKLGNNMANIWRAKGAWRMEPSHTNRCAWPPE